MDFSFKKVDWPLFIAFIALLVIGFAALTSASQVLGFEKFGDAYHFVKQQALHAIAGVALFFVFFFFPATYWKRFAFLMYLVAVGLLVLVLIPGIGSSYGKGVLSWIQIGGFGFQPAELAKFAYILLLAYWFERKSSFVESFAAGTLPFLVYSGVLFGLLALQPDVGTLAVMIAIGAVMYFVSGAPKKYLAILGVVGLVAFGALVAAAPYRLNRVMVFLDPSLDPQGAGYHVRQAVAAVGSGGFLGMGFGKSQSKFNFLPEAPGDSVFAVYAEELGFLFSMILFALFAALLIRGMRGAERTRGLFERYAAVGVVTWISFQALINIGAMIGLVPLTGVPLPFVSYGGTALVAEMAGMGLLLNISRR